MRAEAEDDGCGRGAEADQDSGLLGPAAAGAGRPRGRRAALAAGLAAAALLVAAWRAPARGGGSAWRPRGAVSLTEGGIINVDVVLSNLPYDNLSADALAKNAVEDSVSKMFKGALPYCQVDSEIMAHQSDADATVVQVTLAAPRDKTGDDVASFVGSDAQRERLTLLLADALGHMPSIGHISTGEVAVISVSEGAQDGDLQYTVADVAAGSSTVPMGRTTLKKGDVIALNTENGEGPEQQVTIVSVSEGTLEVQPELVSAYPSGSLVIKIPPEMQTAQAQTLLTTTQLVVGVVASLATIILCAVMICFCVQARGKSAPDVGDESPQLQVMGDPARKDLICLVFKRFDSDCDARLNEDELQVFAKVCCNFSGDAEDWAARYPALCEKFDVQPERGFNLDGFEMLVDGQVADPDKVTSSMYCSDDTLMWVLRTDGVFPPEWADASDPRHGIWV
ncbi:unnamed protein product [Prorocentrum cordatum]|nr:unnamed protein product [Polarella glacialis]